MKNQPDLEYYEYDECIIARDHIIPGVIVADAGVRGGEPCLTGTRLPITAGSWLPEIIDDSKQLAEMRITRDQALQLIAFYQGTKWQASRKRRKRIEEKVNDYSRQWLERNERRVRGQYEPGDEVVEDTRPIRDEVRYGWYRD